MLKRLISVFGIIAGCIAPCAQAQRAGTSTSRSNAGTITEKVWKEFKSPEGRFSILLPETPLKNDDPIETRVGNVPTHTYFVFEDTSVYIILYADMPAGRPDPGQTKPMLDAGRDRMLSQDPKMKLVSEKDISLGAHAGRELIAHDDDTVTRARVYIVNERLYQILFSMRTEVALKPGGNFETRTELFEANSSRFLDSFKLIADSAPLGEVDRMLRSLQEQNKEVMSPGSQSDSAGQSAESGRILNGRAISLISPVYPAIARAAHASGSVSVQVVIDLEGNVIAAQVITGHPLLQAAAIKAARESKFSPTKLDGRPVFVAGVIIYNFVPE
jgi:TonB family protein